MTQSDLILRLVEMLLEEKSKNTSQSVVNEPNEGKY